MDQRWTNMEVEQETAMSYLAKQLLTRLQRPGVPAILMAATAAVMLVIMSVLTASGTAQAATNGPTGYLDSQTIHAELSDQVFNVSDIDDGDSDSDTDADYPTFYDEYLGSDSYDDLEDYARHKRLPDGDSYMTFYEVFQQDAIDGQSLEDFAKSEHPYDYEYLGSGAYDGSSDDDQYYDDPYANLQFAKSETVKMSIHWAANRTLWNASGRKIGYDSVSSVQSCSAAVVKTTDDTITFLSAGNCGNDVETGHALVRKEHGPVAGQTAAFTWLTPIAYIKVPGSSTWMQVELLDSTNVSASNLALYKLTYKPKLDTSGQLLQLEPINLADEDAKLGEQVHGIGFPTQVPFTDKTFSQSKTGDSDDTRIEATSLLAEVSDRNPYAGVQRMLLSPDNTPDGMLGGPVVNTDGDLVGIMAGTYAKGGSSMIAVDLPDIRHFLTVNDVVVSEAVQDLVDDLQLQLDTDRDDMSLQSDRIDKLEQSSHHNSRILLFLELAVIVLAIGFLYFVFWTFRNHTHPRYVDRDAHNTTTSELNSLKTRVSSLTEQLEHHNHDVTDDPDSEVMPDPEVKPDEPADPATDKPN
jgi:hypothetical protein